MPSIRGDDLNYKGLYMSKLFKLKEWLTLDEAASYISKKIDEPVTRADLYQFAINADLKLSVYFANNVSGVMGKWLKTDDIADREESGSIQSMSHRSKSPKSNEMFVSDEDWIAWESGVEAISGVWDLTMRGNEPLDLKALYEYDTSGFCVEATPINDNGILLQKGDVICQLYKPFDIKEHRGSTEVVYNFPKMVNGNYNTKKLLLGRASRIDDLDELKKCHSLSFNKPRWNIFGCNFTPSLHLIEHEFILVIRKSEIARFIQSLEDTPQESKPLTSNERTSLLVLIGALCDHSGIDPDQRGISPSLTLMTELIGAPLHNDTIRKILRQVGPAISARSK